MDMPASFVAALQALENLLWINTWGFAPGALHPRLSHDGLTALNEKQTKSPQRGEPSLDVFCGVALLRGNTMRQVLATGGFRPGGPAVPKGANVTC